jgi:hypothetical protein
MESLNRAALYEAALGNRDGVGGSQGNYFLTLCSVAAPVTVPEPKSASLQRFRFFFTKRRDNGRESYWLHFGYFRTTEEARKWRDVLCRVYPAAAINNLDQGGAQPALLRQARKQEIRDLVNVDTARLLEPSRTESREHQ